MASASTPRRARKIRPSITWVEDPSGNSTELPVGEVIRTAEGIYRVDARTHTDVTALQIRDDRQCAAPRTGRPLDRLAQTCRHTAVLPDHTEPGGPSSSMCRSGAPDIGAHNPAPDADRRAALRPKSCTRYGPLSSGPQRRGSSALTTRCTSIGARSERPEAERRIWAALPFTSVGQEMGPERHPVRRVVRLSDHERRL